MRRINSDISWDAFGPAKAIWMFRSYDNVVNSIGHRWPGFRNQLDAIAVDRNAGDWRGDGMSDEAHDTIRQHYCAGLNDASASALLWFYRNQLFFDQQLERDPRALLEHYEDLVTGDRHYTKCLGDTLGIRVTEAMRRVPHAGSVRKRAAPQLDARIRYLCDDMQKRLESAASNSRVL